MSLDLQFQKTLKTSFKDLSVEDLKPIALGFWHENYLPALKNLNSEEQRKAGYLIDRFRGYNCISKHQKQKLASLSKQIKDDLSQTTQIAGKVDNLEPLARRWMLEEDISHLISPLLKYQTRHYSHSSV